MGRLLLWNSFSTVLCICIHESNSTRAEGDLNQGHAPGGDLFRCLRDWHSTATAHLQRTKGPEVSCVWRALSTGLVEWCNRTCHVIRRLLKACKQDRRWSRMLRVESTGGPEAKSGYQVHCLSNHFGMLPCLPTHVIWDAREWISLDNFGGGGGLVDPRKQKKKWLERSTLWSTLTLSSWYS